MLQISNLDLQEMIQDQSDKAAAKRQEAADYEYRHLSGRDPKYVDDLERSVHEKEVARLTGVAESHENMAAGFRQDLLERQRGASMGPGAAGGSSPPPAPSSAPAPAPIPMGGPPGQAEQPSVSTPAEKQAELERLRAEIEKMNLPPKPEPAKGEAPENDLTL